MRFVLGSRFQNYQEPQSNTKNRNKKQEHTMIYVVRQSLAYIHGEEMMGFIDLSAKDEMSSSLKFETLKLITRRANYQTATKR